MNTTNKAQQPAGRSSPGSGGGRPSSLDEAKRSKLLLALAAGLTQREAAIWVGCQHARVSYLLRHDHEFREELRHYTKLARLHPHLCVYQSSGKSWKAAARLVEQLERRHGKLTTDRLLDALHLAVNRVCRSLHERET